MGGDRREVPAVDGVACHGLAVEVENLPAVSGATTRPDHVPDAIPRDDQRATRRRKRREPPAGRPGALQSRSPEGIRTLATAVRGRRPGPLDDGAVPHQFATPYSRDDESPRPCGRGLSYRVAPKGF